ncbi:MAG: hypothetical protein LBD20_02065 [Spirochaetaceae bacterium]|nr:hypothetical protein [Spirochaetaceae bacterium]
MDTAGGEQEGRINYQAGLKLAIETFQKIQAEASLDLELLILAEYTFLIQEFELCAVQDTRARASLTNAIQDFDGAFLALEVLQNIDVYKFVDKAISHRPVFRYKNMPKDAFHVACAGHGARIDNILKAPGINLLEKDMLKQRHSNMLTAQSVYLGKQKQVL